jgi:hypothetical protein
MALSGLFMTKYFLSTMGRLGATVAGTIRVLLVAIPNFQPEKKETPNEQVSVHY